MGVRTGNEPANANGVNKYMAKGFVYIAQNAAMPGLLKIGYSEKVPTARIQELYTTGVPEPYSIAYYCLVEDARSIEAEVHRNLASSRHSANREFFRVDLEKVIESIRSMCAPEHEWSEHEHLTKVAETSIPTQRSIDHIDFVSRHSVESELREMENFVLMAREERLAPYIVSLFYDSNSCCCSFELADGVDEYGEIAAAIRDVARQTIGQFEWFGTLDHGKPLEEF